MLNVESLIENIISNATKPSFQEYECDTVLIETATVCEVVAISNAAISEAFSQFNETMVREGEILAESAITGTIDVDTLSESMVDTVKKNAIAVFEKIVQAVKNIAMKIKNWFDRIYKGHERWAKKAREALKKVDPSRSVTLKHTYDEKWLLGTMTKCVIDLGNYTLDDAVKAAYDDVDHKSKADEAQTELIRTRLNTILGTKVDVLEESKVKEELGKKLYDKDTVTTISPDGAEVLIAVIENAANGSHEIIVACDKHIKTLNNAIIALRSERISIVKQLKNDTDSSEFSSAVRGAVRTLQTTVRYINMLRSWQISNINTMVKEYTAAVNSLITGKPMSDDKKEEKPKKKDDDDVEVIDAEKVENPSSDKNKSDKTADVVDADFHDA